MKGFELYRYDRDTVLNETGVGWRVQIAVMDGRLGTGPGLSMVLSVPWALRAPTPIPHTHKRGREGCEEEKKIEQGDNDDAREITAV